MKRNLLIILVFLLVVVSPTSAKAVSYEETTQKEFPYNISNFYVEGDYIIINGWGVTNKRQHLTGNDTHEYSMVLTDKKNNNSKVYIAELKYANKTDLMRATHETSKCTRVNQTGCYYDYSYAGFEFKIPLSDLTGDNEYAIKLRRYEKQVNKGYQLSIYALATNNSYEKNGIKYQLFSDISKTSVTVTSPYLFVKSGPNQYTARKQGSKSCGSDGTTLYWYPYGTFNNIIGASQTNPGAIDSELWVNMGYNEMNSCVNDKARVVSGNNSDGWGPWIFMVGSGEPAVIKTTNLETVSIEGMKAYTVPKGEQSKIKIDLKGSNNETTIIRAYHNNSLVATKTFTFSGFTTVDINYPIMTDGVLKVEVQGNYNKHTISSKIYISNQKIYTLDNGSNRVDVETPILVATDKNGDSTEYREQVELTVENPNVVINQGRGIKNNGGIKYIYPLTEFALNNDYITYGLFPSKEGTMSYTIQNDMYKVDMINSSIQRINNMDQANFYLPSSYIDMSTGKIYNSNITNSTEISQTYYPNWLDPLGTHEYQYVVTNLGVNKITIIKNLKYTVDKKMFNNSIGKFFIKRVENPHNLNVIYKKTFTYDELLEYVGGSR